MVHHRPRGYYDTQFNTEGRIENVTEYSTSVIERRALEFLNWFEAHDGTPWLMYVMPIAPHPPATPETRHENAPIPSWSANPAREETDLSDKPGYVAEESTDLSKVKRVRKHRL
jgi:hypothetical protein